MMSDEDCTVTLCTLGKITKTCSSNVLQMQNLVQTNVEIAQNFGYSCYRNAGERFFLNPSCSRARTLFELKKSVALLKYFRESCW